MKFLDPDEQRIEYRNAYLKDLDLEVPDAFADLCGIVTKYRKLLEHTDGKVFGPGFLDERFLSWNRDIFEESPGRLYAQLTDDWQYYGVNANSITKDVRAVESEFIGFVSEWRAFVDRYFLDADWLENHARIVLNFRRKFGDAIEGFGSIGVFDAVNIWTGKPIDFSFPGMRLNTSENAKAANDRYKRAALRAFKSALEQHVADSNLYFKETLNFKQNTKPHKYEYVGWLVLWNTKQFTKDKIAIQVKAELRDIEKRFRELERIGLPYRREVSRTNKRP